MFVEVEGHRIEIARPEKWVWYDLRCTILDLVRYYVAVSPWLLPHLKNRPVVYEIYPGTIHGPSSFEQDPPPATPRWVKRTRIPGHERIVTYVVVDSAAALAYLVSLFMVTLHTWESTTAAIERPDFLLFDLDPPDDMPVGPLAKAALRTRRFLDELGLNGALVKTSGARGLHVEVPLLPHHDFKTVRAFTQGVAHSLARRFPQDVTAQRNRRERPAGTVYIDWGQMGRGMTIVAPYTPRACDGAPVSMPVSWQQVETWSRSRATRPANREFQRFTIANAVDLLKDRGDLWSDRDPQSLTPALSALAAS